MKRALKYILAMSVLVTMASCTKELKFDDSVDKRVDAVIKDYITELSSAEDGWIAELTTSEGIYRFWMDFTNSNAVTMYTDNIHYPEYSNVPKTSTYNIRALLLPTLSFDTYNYIHIPNDPNNDISFGSDNQGLDTDFEYEINAYEGGVFDLTGRINRAKAILRKASHDEMLEVKNGGLLNVIKETVNYKKNQFCSFDVNGGAVSVKFRDRTVNIAYYNEDGGINQTTAMSVVELNRDVMLDEPVNIGSVTLLGFRWDSATETYSAITETESIPLKVSDEAPISLFKMLGSEKIYKTMFTNYYMYVDENMSEDEVAEVMEKNDAFYYYGSAEYYLYSNFGVSLGYIEFDFYLSSANRPRLNVTFVVVNGNGVRGKVSYNYSLTEDLTKETITIGTTVAYENEDSQVVYSYATKPFIDYLKGRKFKMNWSQKEYESELMGELVLEHNSTEKDAVFYGALYE